MSGTSGRRWLAGAATLTKALAWRIRRESPAYLLFAFVPFVVVVALFSALPSLTGGAFINGAASFATFATRYGARFNTVSLGLLLIGGPGLAATFSAVGVSRMARGLVGAEVGRGGLETLLSAPYRPGQIATALLGCVLSIGTGFCLIMIALAALTVAIVLAISGGHLSLSASYFELAFVLPVLAVWAGSGLTIAVNLLLPRLTQLGGATNLAGGDLASGLAVLPGAGALLALLYGAVSLGPARLLLIAGGVAAVILALSVTAVGYGFRPEAALES